MNKKIITFIIIILLVISLPTILIKIFEYNDERLKSENIPTRYEYNVISVKYEEPTIFNEGYYIISFIDSNNTYYRKEISDNYKLQIIISNKNKLIIENPEFNGYPMKYILYYNILG